MKKLSRSKRQTISTVFAVVFMALFLAVAVYAIVCSIKWNTRDRRVYAGPVPAPGVSSSAFVEIPDTSSVVMQGVHAYTPDLWALGFSRQLNTIAFPYRYSTVDGSVVRYYHTYFAPATTLFNYSVLCRPSLGVKQYDVNFRTSNSYDINYGTPYFLKTYNVTASSAYAAFGTNIRFLSDFYFQFFSSNTNIYFAGWQDNQPTIMFDTSYGNYTTYIKPTSLYMVLMNSYADSSSLRAPASPLITNSEVANGVRTAFYFSIDSGFDLTKISSYSFDPNGDRLFKRITGYPYARFSVDFSATDDSWCNVYFSAFDFVDRNAKHMYFFYPTYMVMPDFTINVAGDPLQSPVRTGAFYEQRFVSSSADLNQSYDEGFNIGYDQGFNAGQVSGENTGYTNGYTTGQKDGYNTGFSAGIASANDYSFLGLIGAVIDAPIKAITSLLDFNILGFNMSTFCLSLFTICVLLKIISLISGGA